jgi:hypothetical protein
MPGIGISPDGCAFNPNPNLHACKNSKESEAFSETKEKARSLDKLAGFLPSA